MPFQQLILQIAVALALLLMGWLINVAMLWSALSNFALPWLCTAIGLALLLQTGVAAVRGDSPKDVPFKVARGVIVVVLAFYIVGLILDGWAYGAFGPDNHHQLDWAVSLGEWVGFALLLTGVFALPKMGDSGGKDAG